MRSRGSSFMMARRESAKKAAQMEEKLTGERLAVLEVHLLAEQGWWQQQGCSMY